MEQLMSLLDDHKGSMDDGAYLALSNGLKTAHEAEERSARLFEVSYVQLDSHVDRDENEAVIRGAVRKMIAEEAGVHESPPDYDTRHMNNNRMAKSAEWLSIGKVHHTWRAASLKGPVLLWEDWQGNGKLVAIVTSVTPYRKRVRE
eukprot:4589625-Prymnesium_polylepis.1